MNNYNKKTTLTAGSFSFDDAVDFYKSYLQTPREDWQKELRRPVRTNIFKAMCGVQAKYGSDPIPLIRDTLARGGKVFYWSDLHLFHHNIIEYTGRPFETASHMNQTMLNNYWSTVTDNDLVVFGGDISFSDVNQVYELLKDLPGQKVLVLGNHDFDKNKCTFKNYHIFDSTTMAFVFTHTKDNIDYHVIVSHYPIATAALPENTLNIHGHVHQHVPGPRHINMSVEHTDYTPIEITDSLNSLIERIQNEDK